MLSNVQYSAIVYLYFFKPGWSYTLIFCYGLYGPPELALATPWPPHV